MRNGLVTAGIGALLVVLALDVGTSAPALSTLFMLVGLSCLGLGVRGCLQAGR